MKIITSTLLSMPAIALCFAASSATYSQEITMEGPPSGDPIIDYGNRMRRLAHPNEFVLTSDLDVELIRFTDPRDVEICIGRPDPNKVGDAKKAVAVNVKWDDKSSVIQPGNCMSFDAKTLKVKAAEPLPDDTEISGRFRVIRPGSS